ncbi:MAG: hypothetical protein A2087_11310 [Spirochaetes bacterium GWD1_61_31]|nr:MAG: hypothetical protein A2Y37_01310 [Spirochaetes bacterium GWB1_60_80]OHD33557.1 MAG: hypothetical protein A2004_06610 [Spirochaetes bacterium GWC1_61_12]OHD35705.1 MAG: hypothetical protein A2087_11310 [Spirochaetes bacterium GWD1_61_31]OHD41842.1 MAG: hypothetical protein A2Y35_04405 [Spirochaetes bacterium GWE1_60_18]OHD57822.1 MAG: hypothetical protein A2Y32_14100 [Spirochaetes bacterium GWF1_60_12]HAP42580.1 hypothetical protein [Spirochaetaceae bacterium]
MAYDKRQKRVLLLLVLAAVFDGLTQGILLLQESIARKALAASDAQIAVIGMLVHCTMLLSFFVAWFFAKRSKRGLVAIGGILGRLVFVFSYLITKSWIFLVFLFLYYALFAIQIPVMNGFYRQTFGDQRGKAFGLVRMVLILFTMAGSFIVGRCLDARPDTYRLFLTLVALTGAITYGIIYYIESTIVYAPAPRPALRELLGSLRAIVKRPDFMRFEAIFMTYGLAFMLCVPAVPIYLLRELKLGYAEMSLAQGVVAQSVILLLTPFAGRVFDRMNVWKIGGFSFGMLILYPLLFLASMLAASKGLAYLGLAFYSLGLTGVNVLWNLGATSFSKDEGEAFLLQSFHVSLTGLRGLVGPLLGLLILSRLGLAWNFVFAAGLFAAAMVWSLVELRRR